MKIKTKRMNYEDVMALPMPKHQPPKKQRLFFRWLLKTVSAGSVKAVDFKCEDIGMEKLGKDEPALYLMNHSCFLDLSIASVLLFPRQFHIVCTNDGFVGKNWLMNSIGCIPTKKFVTDVTLVKDMVYAVKKLHSSILMYPEASYSFDGTATPLPETIGKLVKMLGVSVIMIKTFGAFHRDPLYNGLRLRKVKVNATREYLISPEETKKLSAEEITETIRKQFIFDHFRWQDEHHLKVDEDFRATGLERVLYKCTNCGCEGTLLGEGITIRCTKCGETHELTEYGQLARTGKSEDNHLTQKFKYVPDWYAWQRECVKEEILSGQYHQEIPVRIMLLKDTKAVYEVGTGTLTHDTGGFKLEGCDGKIHYTQTPECSYSIYADYFWYEIGDVICIGDTKMQYYCFPVTETAIVAKARLAAEELFKVVTDNRREKVTT